VNELFFWGESQSERIDRHGIGVPDGIFALRQAWLLIEDSRSFALIRG